MRATRGGSKILNSVDLYGGFSSCILDKDGKLSLFIFNKYQTVDWLGCARAVDESIGYGLTGIAGETAQACADQEAPAISGNANYDFWSCEADDDASKTAVFYSMYEPPQAPPPFPPPSPPPPSPASVARSCSPRTRRAARA